VCIDWVRGSTLHPHCRVFFVKVTLLSPVSLPGFFFWNIESARRLADQPMIPAQRALGWLAEASVGSILPNVPGLLDLEHSARLEVWRRSDSRVDEQTRVGAGASVSGRAAHGRGFFLALRTT
jgi:hypothetical protein